MKLIGKAVLFGWMAALMHAGVITGNLLTNPGAETGNISGWVAGGTSNPGVDNGSFDVGINPLSGSFDFYGGSGPLGSLSQTVSIVGNGVTTGMIDSGNLFADLSFWEQGLNQGALSDNAYIQLTFLSATNATLGTISTPSVDSHLGSWTNFAGNYDIPVSTRSITYSMEFVREVGTDLDSFVDDNSLTISGPTSTTPEPSTFFGLGLGLVTLAIRLRRSERCGLR